MSGARARIAVVGGGSWGTALAIHLARAGRSVRLWVHDRERAREMAGVRENRTYLPGFPVPDEVEIGSDLEDAVAGADPILWVVPAGVLGEVAARAAPSLAAKARSVSATKGIEPGSGRRMSEVLEGALGSRGGGVAVLSGPNFAREVARGDPTASVLAARDASLAEEIQEEISAGSFRLYANRDVVGVELGGALKNVIALAAGMVEGLGFGSNTAAALMTRGLSEITRLGVACGGSPATFAGLAGMGDLVLTCTGSLSRNRTVGVRLGRGERLAEILAGMKMVAEGVPTAAAALVLAGRHGVEMPITESVAAILSGTASPREAVAALLRRPLKAEETWG
jgi:glycerol-3-phosphate dehydrogenase (NAD(P)+)